ncbi:MAG: LamG domain-containing protein [Chitinophagaceae bacterium]|nr:MAG: LamG domain-containing protein [Chitinophagaceae bacterium]
MKISFGVLLAICVSGGSWSIRALNPGTLSPLPSTAPRSALLPEVSQAGLSFNKDANGKDFDAQQRLSHGATIPCAVSLDEGLWAWFPFDSDANDKSGNGHHMRLSHGATIVIAEGCSSQKLYFDGQNSFAVIDDGRSFPKGDFALSFSICATDNYQNRIFNRADYSNALGASLTLGFEPSFDGKLCWGVTRENDVCGRYSDLYNTSALLSGEAVSKASWHEVVVQAAGGKQQLYVDGKLSGEIKMDRADFSVCADAPFYFGKWWNQDPRCFKGLLDNIRIYQRELSPEEIMLLKEVNESEQAWISSR